MNVRFFMASILLFGLATACNKTDSTMAADAAPVAVSTPSASASSSASAARVTAESDPLPTHAEAASKVRGEISKTNYKTELDKIEKEIE